MIGRSSIGEQVVADLAAPLPSLALSAEAAPMLRKIWLQQPIAFARVGRSRMPLAAFRWTEPDLRPRGTGRTGIAAARSFDVGPQDGVLRPRPELANVVFKDEEGIRPVCPFFELHGDWEGRAEGESTALTLPLLERLGLGLDAIRWQVRHANHKAYCLTGAEGDRVEAEIQLGGGDCARRELLGWSRGENPLVPAANPIGLGAVQAVRPTAEAPGIRFRFYAPSGVVYGPTDLNARLAKRSLVDRLLNGDWARFRLPAERCRLNPAAAWPGYKLLTYGELWRALPRILPQWPSLFALLTEVQRSELLRFLLGPLADAGKLPPGTFAYRYGGGAVLSSLGLIDDMGDGIITCELGGKVARARIVVCPPHFSPDRRPPVSIADDLTDRVQREEVRSPDWAGPANWTTTEREIDDLFDRAFETAALANLDACSDELRRENISDAVYRHDPQVPAHPDRLLWRGLEKKTVLELPLSEQGHWRHRRNAADEFIEQLMRDSPELLRQRVRDPDDPLALYYDRRMPALMRGRDRRPLHLTRRQLGALRQWVERLCATRRWSG
jgi:hypothetical protein